MPGLGVGEMLEWRIGGIHRDGLGIVKVVGEEALIAGRLLAGPWDSGRLHTVQST